MSNYVNVGIKHTCLSKAPVGGSSTFPCKSSYTKCLFVPKGCLASNDCHLLPPQPPSQNLQYVPFSTCMLHSNMK